MWDVPKEGLRDWRMYSEMGRGSLCVSYGEEL